MSHLEDRLGEFIYEELPASEMETAKRHVSQCLECQGRVADFQAVQHALETVPDVDVPRRTVFVESREPGSKTWLGLRWLVPSATAAALVLALVIAGPIHFDWRGSGMTIAFGAQPEPAPVEVAEAPIVIEPVPVDYEQIVARVTAEQQAWLESELNGRFQSMSTASRREVRRLQAELAYMSDLQRAAQRDTLENSSSIQILAMRTEVQE
jgi:anti-sigma factor RsiW